MIGDLFGSVFGSLMNYASVKDTNMMNENIAAKNNMFNYHMWNLQNEYNSPMATMKRLTDAGINPRAYQQLGQFANAPQPQPAAHYSKTSALAAFQDLAFRAEQLKALRLDNQEKAEDIDRKRYENQDDVRAAELAKIVQHTNLFQSQRWNNAIAYLIKSFDNGIKPEFVPGAEEFGLNAQNSKGVNGSFAWMYTHQPRYVNQGDPERDLFLLKEIGVRNRNDGEALLNQLRKLENAIKSKDVQFYEESGISPQAGEAQIYLRIVNQIIQYLKGIDWSIF